ncbi:hypothetical protein NE235_23950 [Actinoallomurus spadix]|uniref:Uncharacterized protein n=1 Tax=Actinoallomurus spadix TaxID=79912 RepID=A0ABP3G2S5_9ACTN|nr:hypothetical protein [Actinoallomurus spadix]MCO5989163.1 hypothetical protein [Actinoallomurus spadix]
MRALSQADAAALRHRETPPEPSGGTEESRAWYQEALYALYAVSRVSDLLLELGGPAGTSIMGRTGGRALDRAPLAVHEWFFTEVGLERLPPAAVFSPFHHEIFAVTTDEDADAVTVEDVLWPGHRFGDLLFCRAGVRVRAPSRLVDAAVATTSTPECLWRAGASCSSIAASSPRRRRPTSGTGTRTRTG